MNSSWRSQQLLCQRSLLIAGSSRGYQTLPPTTSIIYMSIKYPHCLSLSIIITPFPPPSHHTPLSTTLHHPPITIPPPLSPSIITHRLARPAYLLSLASSHLLRPPLSGGKYHSTQAVGHHTTSTDQHAFLRGGVTRKNSSPNTTHTFPTFLT